MLFGKMFLNCYDVQCQKCIKDKGCSIIISHRLFPTNATCKSFNLIQMIISQIDIEAVFWKINYNWISDPSQDNKILFKNKIEKKKYIVRKFFFLRSEIISVHCFKRSVNSQEAIFYLSSSNNFILMSALLFDNVRIYLSWNKYSIFTLILVTRENVQCVIIRVCRSPALNT